MYFVREKSREKEKEEEKDVFLKEKGKHCEKKWLKIDIQNQKISEWEWEWR